MMMNCDYDIYLWVCIIGSTFYYDFAATATTTNTTLCPNKKRPLKQTAIV